MDFADRLSYLLEAVGKTSYQFAKDSGLSENLIGKWRRGERQPSFESIIVLAKSLNVSIDYLLTGEDFSLPTEDRHVLEAYKAADEGTRRAVDKLLDL